MPLIPSEQELYDEMQATVAGDGATNLTDFSAGSVLDVMAGTVATAARAILRWMQRLVATAFVSTSDGAELDFVVSDRVDLVRLVGESDDDFRARYYAYIEALSRGVLSAWTYYLENEVEGVDPTTISISENLDAGTITLLIRPLSGYSEATIKTNAEAAIAAWRVFGGPFPNVETAA